MKLVLAAMLVVFSASSWAASSVRVYPEYPIDHCDFSRGYLINALFGTTVEEDNTELSINFFTYYYGACKDRVAILEPIPRKSPLALSSTWT